MVQIIAEAGVNHNGDLATALRMVEAAKGAGADVVKFQVYDADLLTSDPAEKAMLEQYEFHPEQWERIAQHCQKMGIEFLGTPFDETSIHLLEMYCNVTRYKVASPDIVNLPLLEKIGSKAKPILLSTGMANDREIWQAVAILGVCNVTLLHCVSEYPCPLDRVNLKRITALKHDFQYRSVGFSDHTLNVETGAMAVVAGATILEKHFTLHCDDIGPDHKMSLMPDELTRYVTLARLAEKAMGTGQADLTEREKVTVHKVRRSLYATRNIEPGEVITAENSIALRPQVEGAYKPIALCIGYGKLDHAIRKGEVII